MWAHRLVAPERFEACEVPTPRADDLLDGHVLVRTTAGGICGSDLPFFRGATSPDGSATANGFGRPGFPLHEIVGEVVASKHGSHAVGDRVVGWASAFDGIAEVVSTDGNGMAPYDVRLPPEVAILIQPLACVLFAMEQLGPVDGKRVAMLGQGPIGLLFSHLAHARGAAQVIGVDRVDRTDLAKVFGVDEAVHAASDRWSAELDPGERPDVVIEAIGHQAATINHAIDAVAFGGRIFYFGIPDEMTYAVNMRGFLRKNLTLQAGVAVDRQRVLAAAGDYLREHPELGKAYVTDVVTVDQVGDGFLRAQRPRAGQAKIAVTMGSDD